MAKFPVDAPVEKIIQAFTLLGFRIIRHGNHISMVRDNVDGSQTPLTLPNHQRIKGSTLRRIITQAGVSRDDFLKIYQD